MKTIHRLVKCPSCGTKVSAAGKPGEKRILTCPNCNKKAVLRFPENTSKHTKSPVSFTTKEKFVIKRTMLFALLAIIVILFLSYIIIPVTTGNVHCLVALSGSMRPTIQEGDIVVSSYINPDQIKAGDIITYHAEIEEDNCITHRVVEVFEEHGILYFKTKGDANEEPDIRLVKETRLIGRVDTILPKLGYIPVFAKSTLGFITLILVPGMLIIINELWRILQIQKEEKRGRATQT